MRSYEIGGKVRISGRWYRIVEVGSSSSNGETYEVIKTNTGTTKLVREFVESYVEPKNLNFFELACLIEDYFISDPTPKKMEEIYQLIDSVKEEGEYKK